MKIAIKVLALVGIIMVVGALIWHIGVGISEGNPVTPINSSPSGIVTFANALMLIALILSSGCCDK